MKFLIYGHRGYLGGHFRRFLAEQGEAVVCGEANIGHLNDVIAELREHQPDFVLNCAGKTGRPNVDWCEDHHAETLYGNVTGPLILLEACHEMGMTETTGPRLVHLGSGCIYDGYKEGKGFTEEDAPNFFGSYYSRNKAWLEQILSEFPVLQLRLRMPIDADNGPRNFITKITHYEKVASVANSMTVIEDLLPSAYELMKRGRTGIYNMTNPGMIDHETIFKMYQEIVDPNFTYQLVPLEELYSGNHIKAGRSNCMLNTDKLAAEGLSMRPIEEAIRDCIEKGFKGAA